MKVCSKCGADKPIEAFDRASRIKKDGRRPECKACGKAYREANRESIRATKRLWYQANKESHNANVKRWQESDWEGYKALVAAWKRDHPERNADHTAAYYARKIGAWDEDVDRLAVWERDGGICGICGEIADPQDWQLDHVIPLSREGRHSYANTQVSHPPCNAWKRDRLQSELPPMPPRVLAASLSFNLTITEPQLAAA